MARKSTKEVEEAVVEEIVEESTKAESVEEAMETKEVVQEEVAKNRKIVAKSPTVFRRSPNLRTDYIVGTMPAGVAFEIIGEHKSAIYGEFYKLGNGYYITKSGSYSIN